MKHKINMKVAGLCSSISTTIQICQTEFKNEMSVKSAQLKSVVSRAYVRRKRGSMIWPHCKTWKASLVWQWSEMRREEHHLGSALITVTCVLTVGLSPPSEDLWKHDYTSITKRYDWIWKPETPSINSQGKEMEDWPPAQLQIQWEVLSQKSKVEVIEQDTYILFWPSHINTQEHTQSYICVHTTCVQYIHAYIPNERKQNNKLILKSIWKIYGYQLIRTIIKNNKQMKAFIWSQEFRTSSYPRVFSIVLHCHDVLRWDTTKD